MSPTADTPPTAPRRRRRGPELERAILEAAWAELTEAGFTGLTMESVAQRAKTGVAVLYRRWPRKDELVLDAMREYMNSRPVEIPDVGDLREDLVLMLGNINAARAELITLVSATFSGLIDSSGISPDDVRGRLTSAPGAGRLAAIFARADERGQIDLSRVPPAVRAVPFDLMRHDLLMTLKPVSEARVNEIVDDIFWPMLVGRGAIPAEH